MFNIALDSYILAFQFIHYMLQLLLLLVLLLPIAALVSAAEVLRTGGANPFSRVATVWTVLVALV